MPKLTKTPAEIRDDFLRTIKNGLIDLGVPNPNVAENSDYFVLGTALADQVSAVFNNIEIQSDASFPDTATGTDLDRILEIYGLSRRPAGGSSGQIIITTSAPTLVPVGANLTSSVGEVYEVTIGGTYSDQDVIPVHSSDTGEKTNLAVDEILTWTDPPAYTQSTAVVEQALTGGVDEEDDETARARLLTRLQNPPVSGNWQHVAEIAEASDPVIQKAFIYQAANGPATIHIAVIGYPSTVSKSREVDSIKLNSLIIPFILGNLPEHTETTITTVNDEPTDCAIELVIPLAVSSTSLSTGPGTGNGWINTAPWPAPNGSTHYFIPISSVTDSTHFIIDSPVTTPPVINITKIHWIDKTDWTIKEATITAYTGTGPYTVTTDTPFVGVTAADWVFPASVNAQTYLDALLEAFKQMGPGEKTSNLAIFSRASRRPRPQVSYPFTLDSSILRGLINSGDEVQTADFWYRSKGSPSQVATTAVTPTVPTLITDPPNILIPRNLGFYPKFPLE